MIDFAENLEMKHIIGGGGTSYLCDYKILRTTIDM